MNKNKKHLKGMLDINGVAHHWSKWRGESMGEYVAMDTETTVIQGRRVVPDLCLATVSDGEHHFVLDPEQVADFVELHFVDRQLIFHNVAFDFAVIDRLLQQTGAVAARNALWECVDSGRMHDTMLLKSLVMLATPGDDVNPRSLDALSERYLGIVLEKETYRLRFHELLGADWTTIDEGFFCYAVKDAIVTWRLFELLEQEANQIVESNGVSRDYGLLTETLQVKGAIALDRITRNGLHIDSDRLARIKNKFIAWFTRSIR